MGEDYHRALCMSQPYRLAFGLEIVHEWIGGWIHAYTSASLGGHTAPTASGCAYGMVSAQV